MATKKVTQQKITSDEANPKGKRFVTRQNSDGLWVVYDKQKDTYDNRTYENRQDALNLAKIFEDHANSLKKKRTKK